MVNPRLPTNGNPTICGILLSTHLCLDTAIKTQSLAKSLADFLTLHMNSSVLFFNSLQLSNEHEGGTYCFNILMAFKVVLRQQR
jgi:hypothetical protein